MGNELSEVNELLSSQGWESLTKQAGAKENYKQEVETFKYAEQIAAAFGTRAGKAALENLRAKFVEPPTWTPNVTNIDDTTAYGFVREGQKSVFTFIQNCIKRVEQGPPQAPEE